MNDNINRLQKFRNDTYNLLGFAQDSTYDLIDAVLTTRKADSLADFSLSPLFKRQWSSTYESLQDCRPNPLLSQKFCLLVFFATELEKPRRHKRHKVFYSGQSSGSEYWGGKRSLSYILPHISGRAQLLRRRLYLSPS